MTEMYDYDVMIEKAKEMATRYHAGQKYGDLPYTSHLQDVVNILHKAGYTRANSPEFFQVAWLHDILEDTECLTEDLVEAGFSQPVIDAVNLCTDERGANREERKLATYLKVYRFGLLHANDWFFEIGRAVKIADRIANLNSSKKNKPALFQRYLKEDANFHKVYFQEPYPWPVWNYLYFDAKKEVSND